MVDARGGPIGGTLAKGVIAVAVPIALVAAGVWLLASPGFLRWEYGRPGFPAPEGFTVAERLELAVPATLSITRRHGRPADLAALEVRGRQVFDTSEIDHLADVRRLVGWLTAAGGVAGAVIVAAAAAIAFQVPGWTSAAAGVRLGGLLCLALALGVAAAAALAWPALFVGFHRLLFPPGTWQFPASSTLIRLFPNRFWFDTALVLLAMVAAGGVAAVLLGRGSGSRRGEP